MKQIIKDMLTLIATVLSLSMLLALGGIAAAWLWSFL